MKGNWEVLGACSDGGSGLQRTLTLPPTLPPLIHGGYIQGPQRMSETAGSTETCVYNVCSYTHIPVLTFNL